MPNPPEPVWSKVENARFRIPRWRLPEIWRMLIKESPN